MDRGYVYPTWGSGLNRSADDDFDGVDELDDYETAPSVSAVKPRKPRAKPSTSRKPGQTILPVQKVEGIVKSDLETAAVSKEAMQMFTVSTEEFIKKFVQTAFSQVDRERRSTILYRDMAATARDVEEYQFLADAIPEPITLGKALALREAKLRGEDEEPLLAPARAPLAHVSSKGKGKAYTSGSRMDSDANSRASTPRDHPKSHKIRVSRASLATVNGSIDESIQNPADIHIHTNGRSSNGAHRRSTLPAPLLTRIPLPAPPSASSSRHFRDRDALIQDNSFDDEQLTLRHPQDEHPMSTSKRYHPYYAGPQIPKSPMSELQTHTHHLHHHHHHMPPPPSPPREPWLPPQQVEEDELQGDYRGTFSPMGHNPGRTIYSHQSNLGQ